MEKNENAKLCEIAYICGTLKEQGKISIPDMDLNEMYDKVYLPVFKEWESGIENHMFINSDEEGYISAYAQRRLLQLFGK